MQIYPNCLLHTTPKHYLIQKRCRRPSCRGHQKSTVSPAQRFRWLPPAKRLPHRGHRSQSVPRSTRSSAPVWPGLVDNLGRRGTGAERLILLESAHERPPRTATHSRRSTSTIAIKIASLRDFVSCVQTLEKDQQQTMTKEQKTDLYGRLECRKRHDRCRLSGLRLCLHGYRSRAARAPARGVTPKQQQHPHE